MFAQKNNNIFYDDFFGVKEKNVLEIMFAGVKIRKKMASKEKIKKLKEILKWNTKAFSWIFRSFF